MLGKRIIKASALYTAITLAGCGGGGGSGGATTPLPPLSFKNGQAAAVVIGQPDFTSGAANRGGSADANTLNNPVGAVTVAGGTLYIPDTSNHRVLGFNTIPTVDGSSASFALGQPDFTTTSSPGDPSATTLYGPRSPAADGTRWVVTDAGVPRILIWNTPPTGAIGASLAIGQPDLTSNYWGGCSDKSLATPYQAILAGDKLIVADFDNNRVMVWSGDLVNGGMAASLVLGQKDMVHCAANDLNNDGITDTPSASTMRRPQSIWSDGTRLAVVDSNHRVLLWDTFPSSNGQAADRVLGQTGMTVNSSGQGADQFSSPTSVTFAQGKLFVADAANNRILIWDSWPSENGQPADRVLGKSDFTASNNGVSETSLHSPSGVHVSGNQLFVTDTGNHRVLIYNAP